MNNRTGAIFHPPVVDGSFFGYSAVTMKWLRLSPHLSCEIQAGLTNFLATAYIAVVNPLLLAEAGMPLGPLVTATVATTIASTLLMGWLGKMPIVVAPGMGLNAFFTYSLVLGMDIPWPTALGMVFWTGVIFMILSAFHIRTMIVQAIAPTLRYGIAAGIGLFVALIGLANANFVVAHPATLVQRGPMGFTALVFIAGLAWTAWLYLRKVRASFLLGMLTTAFLALVAGTLWPEHAPVLQQHASWVAWPDFSLFGQLDIWGALRWSLLPPMFALLLTDLFDSLSTFMGLSEMANMKDSEGQPKNIRGCLWADALGTTLSGLLGTSPATSYVESAAGIAQGGRTGKAAWVTAACFVPLLFLAPALSMLPKVSTSPILVIVGSLMMTPLLKVQLDDFEEALPAFLALILIPMTFSITQGIIWSFLAWTFIKVVQGKARRISPTMWVLNLCMVGLIWLT
jgi:AGZA family xanthine/uracil permease-like MFS transporter